MQSNGLSADISLNPSPFPHQPQNPQTAMQFQHPQIVPYTNNPNPQTQPKQSFQYVPPKPKQLSPLSEEDDNTGSGSGSGFNTDSGTTPDGKRKFSPWQRMKWTDTMVRFLIVAVFYIGDDGGSESADPSMKKCNGGGFLQKKGKWKSVSKAMMEKGFCVSPQQCEDKFNDLNKRYKRVNDILGKGTACRVVENQSLLETMDLSPKMKNEVKKLLNSKHLFFREMCAYHNSCGHLTGNSAASNEHPHQQQQQTHQKQEQETCSHSSDTSSIQNLVNSNRCEVEGAKLATIVESEDDSDDVSEGYSDDDSEDEDVDADGEGTNNQGHEEDENSSKRRRKAGNFASMVNQLNLEASNVMQDSTKSAWEKKQWIRTKMMQLEDQQLSYKRDALELEKQRLKWMKFSSKKEREMERAKLENDRKRFENERMVLTMKQKELELLDLHHHNHQLCHSPINRL